MLQTAPYVRRPGALDGSEGSTPEIYDRALAVSTPKPYSEADTTYPFEGKRFTHTTLRRVEVPFVRQVKVPTLTHKVQPTTVLKRVPIKRLVEVQTMQEVDEDYTVLTDPSLPPNATPEQIVAARAGLTRATLKVPRVLKRKVLKPVTVIQEVDDWAEVEVPASTVVEVEGFRIDEVEDTKVVEVEEAQEYELRPVPVGTPYVRAEKEVGRLAHSRISRSRGADVYAIDHPVLNAIEQDNEPDALNTTSQAPSGPVVLSANSTLRNTSTSLPSVTSYGSAPRGTFSASGLVRASTPSATIRTSSGINIPTRSYYRPHGERAESPVPYGQYDRTGYTDPKTIVPAGSYKKLSAATSKGFGPNSNINADPELVSLPVLGITVKNTHTNHTDGTGVYITKVDFGGPSARAGLRENDLVTTVQGQPATTVDEFKYAVSRIPGPLVLQINRDGRRNLAVTVYR